MSGAAADDAPYYAVEWLERHQVQLLHGVPAPVPGELDAFTVIALAVNWGDGWYLAWSDLASVHDAIPDTSPFPAWATLLYAAIDACELGDPDLAQALSAISEARFTALAKAEARTSREAGMSGVSWGYRVERFSPGEIRLWHGDPGAAALIAGTVRDPDEQGFPRDHGPWFLNWSDDIGVRKAIPEGRGYLDWAMLLLLAATVHADVDEQLAQALTAVNEARELELAKEEASG